MPYAATTASPFGTFATVMFVLPCVEKKLCMHTVSKACAVGIGVAEINTIPIIIRMVRLSCDKPVP